MSIRYRIVIEVDAEASVMRRSINELAEEAMQVFVCKKTNPVYLATEIIGDKQRNIIREVD